MKRSFLQKEWNNLLRKERKLIQDRQKEEKNFIEKKLDSFIPAKLQEVLNKAIFKGFEAVFEKGSGLIEKTYEKEKYAKDYQIKEYAMKVLADRKSLRSFAKVADRASTRNLIITGVEGTGLGLLGIGIPDIPIFLSVILKSIYEIALSFGYSYDTDRERLFILKILKASMETGNDILVTDKWINNYIEAKEESNKTDLTKEEMKEQMKESAEALSKELLYMKFIQGLPLIGAVGGITDIVYLNRITKYATLKYQRRFLRDQLERLKGE